MVWVSTAALVWLPSAPTAAAVVAGCDDPGIGVVGDLDGDGVPEVLVGMPTYPGGGAVDLRSTAGGGMVLTAASLGLWAPASPDRFGAAVVVTELNGDRCADLVIGAPGRAGTGAVAVVLGSPDGYRAADASLVPTPTQKAGAEFGASLAVSFRRPDEPLLVAGMPGYPVSGHRAAGAVVGYQFSGGVPGAAVVANENTPDVAGVAETGDRFGSVLAPTFDGVIVGTPLEDSGSVVDAGAVTLLVLSGSDTWIGHTWSEATPGVVGVAEAGDHFGAAVLDDGVVELRDVNNGQITVGVPGEDIGSDRDTGAVVSLSHLEEETRSVLLHQDGTWQGAAVPGVGETGDAFGSSLGWRGRAQNTRALVVGVPGEDVGSTRDSGALVTFEVGPELSGTMASVTESNALFRGYVEAGDRFGATLASGWYATPGSPAGNLANRLMVGIPGEDVHGLRDAGAIAVSDEQRVARTVTLSTGARPGTAYGAFPGAPSWAG